MEKMRMPHRHLWDPQKKEFKRLSTGLWEWEPARQFGAQIEPTGTRNKRPDPPAQAPQSIGGEEERVTIERAVKAFMAEIEAHASVGTGKQYRLLLGKLTVFARSKGYVMIDQFHPIDIRDMRSGWAVSPRTATKNIAPSNHSSSIASRTNGFHGIRLGSSATSARAPRATGVMSRSYHGRGTKAHVRRLRAPIRPAGNQVVAG